MVVLSICIALCAALYELDEHLLLKYQKPRFLISPVIIFFTLFILFIAIISLLRRLRQVVFGESLAHTADLLLVICIYIYAIGVFGFVFLAIQNIIGNPVFKDSTGSISIEIIDALYISGITIATVGYGDITPLHWSIKFLAIGESMLGLGLTAIVAGFFIGSLLSRQQQDKEARFFGGFQRHYLSTLTLYRKALLTLDELGEGAFETLLEDMLGTLKTLVVEYQTVISSDVSVNWMQFYNRNAAPEEVIELVREFVPSRLWDEAAEGTFEGVLVLRNWNDKPDEMPGIGQFALPVYKSDSKNHLPGAPEALVKADGYDIVSDTGTIDLSNQDEDIRDKLVKYFEDHASDLKSFVSVRMEIGQGVLGVVNINSKEIELCGTSIQDQRILAEMIKPFAELIAEMVVYKADLEIYEHEYEEYE